MLVHIVPTVPPAINGVGDYCYKLWENWPEPKPAWHCLAAELPTAVQRHGPGVEVSPFELSRPGLLQALDLVNAQTVVLHYVGYAYHPKGCPTWLPMALKEWKHTTGKQLIVMFHELYAKGKPWQTSFWLYPVARRVVIDLLKVADRSVTSCREYQTELEFHERDKHGQSVVIPVGATILPPPGTRISKPWPLQRRSKLKIVVFGLPGTRLWALQWHKNLLRRICELGMVESILLLGQSANSGRFERETQLIVNSIGFHDVWHTQYNLSAQQLSEVLLAQDVGFLSAWPNTAAKSTVYAALCAHGVLPIAVDQNEGLTQGAMPCLKNDDQNPEMCLRKLQDERVIKNTKVQVANVSDGLLNWKNIAREWFNITNPGDLYLSA